MYLFDSHYFVVFIFYSLFQYVVAYVRVECYNSCACLMAYFSCIYLIESLKGFLYSSLAVSALESYILNQLRRSALLTTQKLERLMAAAPNIGFNCHPNSGIHTPAASGIPMAL